MNGTTTTVAAAWRHAQQHGLDRLDAQMLLLHSLGHNPLDRAWLVAHDTDTVAATPLAAYQALVRRRLAGEPVAYLTGQRAFYGLTLQVDARVLDPRPDTETLVDWALACLAGVPHPTVLDLGTGSGAIALAIQHQRPDAQVWAVDSSPGALAVAQNNGQRLGLGVRFVQNHWLQNWAQHPAAAPQRFHLIASNPPYIRNDDPHLAQLTHEPLGALASGPDGLQDIREIADQALAHLAPGGWLLLEHGWDQGADVAAILRGAAWVDCEHRHDLSGHTRCTGARKGPVA